MTETEKLRRAQQYLTQLAQGINPLAGQDLAEDSLLSDVRLSRCFFYVSEVLQGLLEDGAAADEPGSGDLIACQPPTKTRSRKESFRLTGEQRAELVTLPQPVSISEFVRMINDCVDDPDRRKLGYKLFNQWLVGKGFLQVVPTGDGRTRTTVTDQAELIGITIEQRTGASGTYEVVLYTPEAQQFLLDNLGGILAGE